MKLDSLQRLCAALVAVAFFLPAQAQTVDPADASRTAVSQYKIDAWQTEQGLPQNTVSIVHQARDGHLWVGTVAGLARFDGVRFTTFEGIAGPELTARPIYGLMEDAEGTLWIGHSAGATRYRKGQFERVFATDLLEGRRVWAFAQDKDGTMWAASENGLLRWDAKGTRVFKEADGLPTLRLRTLVFDTRGVLWIGTTGGGLVSYAEGRFTVMPSFPHPEVRQLVADPDGSVWAATAGAGLVHVANGTMRTFTIADGLPTDQLTSLARDSTGALWIGTWGSGVTRLRDGRFSSVGSAGGLAGDQVWTLQVDREGSVWVGTWNGGLNRLSQRAFVVFGKPEGLAGDNVRSVIQARDGAMWVATAGGGVSRLLEGQILTLTRKEGLPSDEASALFEDLDGAIWIGTYTGGVARWLDGRITSYGLKEGLPNVDVRTMLRDRAGTLWVGTASGLARLDGDAFVAVSGPDAPSEGVATLLEDRAGTLWIGTTGKGLFRYRDGKFQVFTRKEGLPSNFIIALHEDTLGSLWIGTNGEGLARMRDGQVRGIGTAQGLWDGLVQVILEDRAGNLWITCNRGFFRVARSELDAVADGKATRVVSTSFGPGDSLRSTTFAGLLQPAGAIDTRGVLWLPSLKGLVIVDPARLPGSGVPPAVSIEEVLVDGVVTPAQGSVVLPPGSNALGIRYSSGTLLNAERARFRYNLEGISANWVDAGRSREVTFPALPKGRYIFRVAATTDGKRWQEIAQPLAITVQPHFYETGWFLALALLSLVAAGTGIYRLRTHALRGRGEEMERLVALKTEELRVANEHLSRLSFADSLTGLPNRRRLDEALDTEWRRALRAQATLAVVIADIDAFKAYNDSLGHPEGDRSLIAVAEVIRESTSRASDFAARYGGEEFVILLPGADLAGAMVFAESLRAAVQARAIPHPASTVAPVVTVSLGVASRIPAQEGSAAELFAAADAALYRAKQQGRNRVEGADEAAGP